MGFGRWEATYLAGAFWRWAAQGYRLYEQGRFDAAAQAARQAVGAEPQNSEYRSLLIHSLQAANHADAALVAVREAIAQYVEREEKREAFRQEALAAWAAYQETGLHVTHDEADTWLAQLEAGQDVEPPECHS